MTTKKLILHRLPSRSTLFFLSIPIIIGIFLRFLNIGTQSLWADEAYSVVLAAKPVKQILLDLLSDSSPPFYYLTLKIWMCVFGHSEPAVRSLSALVSSITLLFSAIVIWRLTRNIVISSAVILYLALTPSQIYFAQETRSYAMMSMLFVIITNGILSQQRDHYPWYLVPAIIVSIYTHNYGWLIWISYILWSLTNSRKYYSCHLIIAAFSLLWLPGLLIQIQKSTTAWVPRPRPIHMMHTLFSYAGNFQFAKFPSMFLIIISVFASGFAILAFIALVASVKKWKETSLFLFSGPGPIMLAFFISYWKPVFLPGRHDIIFMAPFVILSVYNIVVLIQSQRQKHQFLKIMFGVFFAFMILIQAAASHHYYFSFIKANDRDVAKTIIETGVIRNSIIVTTDVTYPAFFYYLDDAPFIVISFPLGEKGYLPIEFLNNTTDYVDKEIEKLLDRIDRVNRTDAVILAVAGNVEANERLVSLLNEIWIPKRTIRCDSPRPANSVHRLTLYHLDVKDSLNQTNEDPRL